MASRIVNLSNGHRYKFNQAKRLVEQQCACAWVQYGVSVRELSVEEMVKARSEQAKKQEPLAYAEVHGLRYDPAASGVAASRAEGGLIFAAHQFKLLREPEVDKNKRPIEPRITPELAALFEENTEAHQFVAECAA